MREAYTPTGRLYLKRGQPLMPTAAVIDIEDEGIERIKAYVVDALGIGEWEMIEFLMKQGQHNGS